MPSVASVAASIEREGEPVQLLRNLPDGGQLTASLKAFVRGFKPEELGGGIIQGDRAMHVAPATLAAAGFPDAPRKPDQATIAGRTATVQSCETRRLRGVPCVHIVQVRGL